MGDRGQGAVVVYLSAFKKKATHSFYQHSRKKPHIHFISIQEKSHTFILSFLAVMSTLSLQTWTLLLTIIRKRTFLPWYQSSSLHILPFLSRSGYEVADRGKPQCPCVNEFPFPACLCDELRWEIPPERIPKCLPSLFGSHTLISPYNLYMDVCSQQLAIVAM